LAQMHALYDVAAVVEHPFDVFRVHGAGKVRIAVVLALPRGRADALTETELISPKTSENETDTLTRNSSRIKYLALNTSGCSLCSFGTSGGG